MAPAYRAEYAPRGCCPKAWVAVVDGKDLQDSRGAPKRYATEAAALKAARKAAEGR